MMRRIMALGFLSLVLLPAHRHARAAPAHETWQCVSNTSSPTDPTYQILLRLAADIGKASGGRITVLCHPSGALPIKAGDVAQAVSEDVLQFAVADSLAYNSLVPAAAVISLPGLFGSDAALDKGIAAVMPMLRVQFAKRNATLLAVANYPLQVLWSTTKLVSLADLKGMKLRVSTAQQAEFAARFGAVPITMGIADVGPALQRGIIEELVTASSGGGRILRDILRYNLRTGPNYVSTMLIVNRRRFDALPKPLQDQIALLTAQAAHDMTSVLRGTEGQLTAEFAKQGMVVTPGTPEDAKLIAARMSSYWPQWAASNGPAAKQALSIVEQAIKD